MLIYLILVLPALAQDVGSGKTDFIQVHSKEGILNAAARRFPLQRSDANQRMNTAPIESLVLPTKNLLWVGSSNYQYFFLLNNKIVGLRPVDGPELWVCYSTTNLISSVDITNVVDKHVSKRLRKLSEDPLRSDYILTLRRVFGVKPFVNESTWRTPVVPTIEGVTFENEEAILHLHILGGNFTVTLDGDLEVMEASQEGKPVALHGKIPLYKLTADPE